MGKQSCNMSDHKQPVAILLNVDRCGAFFSKMSWGADLYGESVMCSIETFPVGSSLNSSRMSLLVLLLMEGNPHLGR